MNSVVFALERDKAADATVYNLAAEPVRKISAGSLYVALGYGMWDGTDDGGAFVPSGMYILVIRQAGISSIVRITVVR